MKAICCDASLLISLYGHDPNTGRAKIFAASLKMPITISGLNQFELEQAINFLVWRKQLPPHEGQQIKAFLVSDCASGSLVVAPSNLTGVLTPASRLSAKYTQASGHRSMDILQVASAIELRAEYFLTLLKTSASSRRPRA